MIVLLESVKRLSKALRFFGGIFISTIAHMHIALVTCVDKLLLLILVILLAIFNEDFALMALKWFDD